VEGSDAPTGAAKTMTQPTPIIIIRDARMNLFLGVWWLFI
jgi:hypothetical protein